MRTGVRCELCLSLSHPTRECTLVGDTDPDISARLKTLESAILAFTAQPPQQQSPSLRSKSIDICRNWNTGRCRMSQCRYRHACRVCGGPNPAYACCDRALAQRPNPTLHPTMGQATSVDPPFGMPTLQTTPQQANIRRSGPGPADRYSRVRPGTLPY